jgi:YbbR domain-containing protein
MHNKNNKQSNTLTDLRLNFNIFRNKAKNLWLLLWRKDAFIFLLFVGLTSIFWWGHVMSSSRDMSLKIPIIYSGISEEIVIDEELPTTLTIVVRDDGKRLRQISRSDIQTKLQLGEFIQQANGEVHLTTDILRSRIQDLLPGSTNIQKILPEEIFFTYHIQHTKLVPVHIQADVDVAPQHQMIGDVELSQDSVRIFGANEVIDSILYIATDSIIVRDLRDSVCITTGLVTPQNVRVVPNQISAQWHAEPFTEKSFKLPIKVVGLPKGERIRLFPQKADVTVRVGISNYTALQAKDIQLFCQYPEHDCQALLLQVKTTKPYIYNIRISPSSVEYIIER